VAPLTGFALVALTVGLLFSVLVAVWYTSAVWLFDLVGIGF
jgi:hypothetical protein